VPISFIPTGEKDCWFGSTWMIEDEDVLADMIARVAIGQSRTVERILHATDASLVEYPTGGFVGARSLLAVEEGQDSYHRDGWVFQVISWIAAHSQDDDALIRAPQMIKADKGLDGLIVEFNDDGVAQAIICEEKATENARQKVQSAVWPEFMDFETGARDNELVASVTALLAQSGDLDPDRAVADILWQDTRAYRVAVTVDGTHRDDVGRKSLFKGYEVAVSGDVTRRRAETLFLDDMRSWVDLLAMKAVAIIDVVERTSHV